MGVQGVGSGNPASTATGQKSTGIDDVVQDFLSYMKETPAQRMEDKWLRAHGLTRAQFEAMSPEDQQKILAQMKQDIEQQVKQGAENALYGKKPTVPSVL